MAGLKELLVGLRPVHGTHELGLSPLLADLPVDHFVNDSIVVDGPVALLVLYGSPVLAVNNMPLGLAPLLLLSREGVRHGHRVDQEGEDVGLIGGIQGPGDTTDTRQGHRSHTLVDAADGVEHDAISAEGRLVPSTGRAGEDGIVERCGLRRLDPRNARNLTPHICVADTDAPLDERVVGCEPAGPQRVLLDD